MSCVSLEPSFWQSPVWEHLPRTWALCSARNEEEFGFRHYALVVKVNVSSKGERYCQTETFTCHVSTTKKHLHVSYQQPSAFQKIACASAFMGFGLETEKFYCHPRAPLSAPPHPRLCPHSFWNTEIKAEWKSTSEMIFSIFAFFKALLVWIFPFKNMYSINHICRFKCIVSLCFQKISQLYPLLSIFTFFMLISFFIVTSKLLGWPKSLFTFFSWWKVYYPRFYSGPFLYNLFFLSSQNSAVKD